MDDQLPDILRPEDLVEYMHLNHLASLIDADVIETVVLLIRDTSGDKAREIGKLLKEHPDVGEHDIIRAIRHVSKLSGFGIADEDALREAVRSL